MPTYCTLKRIYWIPVFVFFLLFSINTNGQCPANIGDTLTFPGLATNMGAWYPLNGNAKDSSGNGNHGTVTNAYPANDRFGNPYSAYQFDGNGYYIKVPRSTSVEPKDSLTVSAWVYMDDTTSVWHQVVCKRINPSSNPYNSYILFGGSPNSSQYLAFNISNTSNEAGASKNSGVYSKNWYFLTGTYNRAKSGNYRGFFYVNGNLIDSFQQNGQVRYNTSNDLYIGQSISGASPPQNMKGRIDDVRLYSKALCNQEIKALYGNSIVLKVNAINTILCAGNAGKVQIINPEPNINYKLIKLSNNSTVDGPYAFACADTIKLSTGTLNQSDSFKIVAFNPASSCSINLDSTFHFIISNSYNDTIDTSVCKIKGIYFNGQQRYNTGTYTANLKTSNNCDSIVTLKLQVFNEYVKTDSFKICENDSIYLQKSYQRVAGVYYDTIKKSGDCDSIIKSILSVLILPSRTRAITICENDSIYLQKSYRKTPGNYYDTIDNLSGCDSVIKSVLSVQLLPANTKPITICENDSIYLQKAYRKNPGNYYDTIDNGTSCDSVIKWVLSIQSLPVSSRQVVICQNDSVFLQNQYRNTSGIYYDTVKISGTCDSVVKTDLIVNQITFGNQSLSLCSPDSIFLGKKYRKTSGIYYDTLLGVNGCDSVLTTALTIKNSYSVNQSKEICPGDSLKIGNKYRKTAGVYNDTLISSSGCDSILIIDLKTHQITPKAISNTICNNDSMFFNGKYLKIPGTYFDTVFTSSNCIDTIISLSLNVLPSSFQSKTAEICEGDFVVINGKNVSVSGIYYDSLKNSLGCDSVIGLNLIVHKNISFTNTLKFCEDDSLLFKGAYYKSDTVFYDTLSTIYNCDSIVVSQLYRSDRLLDIEDSAFYCDPILTNVDAGLAKSYLWSNSFTGRYLRTNIDGLYWVTVVDTFDCIISDTVRIIERCNPKTLIPNAFTPNNDGLNDFLVFNIENVDELKFKLFNRWGQIVFETEDRNTAWDGKFKGEVLPSGSYFWICSYNGLSVSGKKERMNENGILYILR